MKLPQVITIHKDGAISGLQRKDGFDLRQLGHARINRASDVVWSEDKQRWFVEFRNAGPFGRLTAELMESASSHSYPVAHADDHILYFSEYDHAVEAEIIALDHLRLMGVV